jgi:molybdopterin converting factor subunit 1
MITVKLYAVLREKAGQDELHVNAGITTVSELLREVSNSYPSLCEILSCGRVLTSVNREFVKGDAPVKSGDEVALMPPFSGGSGQTGHVHVQKGPFSLDREIEQLKQSSQSIGAVVTFVGTTRDISKNRQVTMLEFEYYPGMAEQKLREIRDRAIREFGVIDVSIIHRIGAVPVGENIVLIAVVAMHRDEAFRACRFCIDELKRTTPIWKKETTQEGVVWVEEHP